MHPSWTDEQGNNLSSYDRMLEQDPEPYGLDPALRVLEEETGVELTSEEFDEAICLQEMQTAREEAEEALLREQIRGMFDWVIVAFAPGATKDTMQVRIDRGMAA